MTKVLCEVAGNVWKVEARIGQEVAEGDVLVIVESMKMEIPVEAPRSGVVAELHVREGEPIDEGDLVAVLR